MRRGLLAFGFGDSAHVPLLAALAARGFTSYLAPPSLLGEARAAGVAAEDAFALLDDATMAGVQAERRRFAERLEALEEGFSERFTAGGLDLWRRMRTSFRSTLEMTAGQAALMGAMLEALARRGELAAVLLGYDMTPAGRAGVEIARRLGVPSIHVPHAVFPRPRVSMPWQGARVYADRVCAPGKFSRDRYLGDGAAPEAVVLTGSPRWDEYAGVDDARRAECRALLARELRLDPGAPVVLFGPSWIERSTANASQHVVGALAVYRGVLAAVRAHPSAQLVVKLHPGELTRPGLESPALIEGYAGVARRAGVGRIAVTAGYRRELVAAADVVVTVNSNLGLEALLCGRPLVNVPLIPEEANLLFAPGDGVLALGSPGDLEAALAATLGDAALRARLAAAAPTTVQRYVHRPDGHAGDRVACAIRDFVSDRGRTEGRRPGG